MIDVAVWFSIFLAFGFGALQSALVFGAPLGEYVLGGQNRVLSKRMRIVSAFFVCFFTIVGLAFLHRTGKATLFFNDIIVTVLLAIYTLFLGYAIIGNGFLTKSTKEKYLMTPLSVIGFVCSVVVLLAT